MATAPETQVTPGPACIDLVETLTLERVPYVRWVREGSWQCIPCGEEATRAHLAGKDRRRETAVWLLGSGYSSHSVRDHWGKAGNGAPYCPGWRVGCRS